MQVSFHPAARDEVERAQAWYEGRSLIAAAAFLQDLTSTIQRIREAPNRYRTAEHGTRRIPLGRFPFTVFYLSRPDKIQIVAVAHQKRRPGYWMDRTRAV